MDALDQAAIDQRLIALDGTANKGKLGANAILGVSMATAHAAANAVGLPLLPLRGRGPCAHAACAADEHPQRWRPRRHPGRHPGIHGGAARRAHLRRGAALGRGGLSRPQEGASGAQALDLRSWDEGGYAPDLPANEEALKLILEAITAAGYRPGDQVGLALDAAASEFFDAKTRRYRLKGEGKEYDAAGLVGLLPGAREALPHRLHRGRHGRGRLGGLEAAHPGARRQAAAGGGRPLRHQLERLSRGIAGRRRQLASW